MTHLSARFPLAAAFAMLLAAASFAQTSEQGSGSPAQSIAAEPRAKNHAQAVSGAKQARQTQNLLAGINMSRTSQ